MITRSSAAIVLLFLAIAMIGHYGACADQLRIGLPSRVITLPTPTEPVYQPQLLTMDAPEYRMSWVFSFGSEFASPTATSTLINTLADNNFNVVVPEIRKRGDAYYNSAYEPWATDVVAGYDPLRDLLDKAHARNMEVWGWIVTFRIWQRSMVPPATHIWAKHPDWACIDRNGSNAAGSYYNLDPGIPGVQQYVCDVMKDAITKYPDLDGYNFDYIRYDSNTWGYNPISKERFRSEYGYYPPRTADLTNPQWLAWNEWKRRQVSDFVKKCYLEAIYINPHIKMSTDTIGWMGGNPNTDFTGVRCYYDVCQDHKSWMENHFIDVNVLMNYKRDWTGLLADVGYRYKGYPFGNQQADHRIWSDWLGSMQTSSGTHVVDGIGGYMNVMQGILDQWNYSRTNGVGLGMYRYGFTLGVEDAANPGLPVFNSGTSTVKGPTTATETAFYSTIKSTMFQNPAAIPDMPWKSSPTSGYLFGQVTDALEPDDSVYQNWIYNGTVTAVGPTGPSAATYTCRTDATGTYGFLRLPPGDYTLTVSRSGYGTANSGGRVTIGTATRVNVALGLLLGPQDYKTVSQALDRNQVADNQVIGLSGKVATVATGTFPSSVYVEEPDRSCGIQVTFGTIMPVVAEGDRVEFIGLANTVNGERTLAHAALVSKTPGAALGALQSSVQDLDRGPASAALLVRCTGKVIETGIGWFTVDDGSGVVKAVYTGLIGPARNAMVTITGVSGYSSGRIIRLRRQSDIVVSAAAAVTAPTELVGTGFNLISLPYVPTDPSPSVVFGTSNLTDKLFRWDNTTQAFVGYDLANPNIFGKLSPTQGLALLATTAPNVRFQGVPVSADARISVPKTGWSLIAEPFTNAVLWNHVMVTDGTRTLTLQDAITAGWIGRIAFTWDVASANWGYVGTGARGSRFDDSLRPWRGYWITTYRDNLAIIIPAAG